MERHCVPLPVLHLGQSEAKSQAASNTLLFAQLHQDINLLLVPHVKA